LAESLTKSCCEAYQDIEGSVDSQPVVFGGLFELSEVFLVTVVFLTRMVLGDDRKENLCDFLDGAWISNERGA
jgi:hypothetical protein